MADVNLYNNKGESKGKVALPAVFSTPYRPDIIRKAVSVARANRRQRYGAHPMAGKRHSTQSVGKGRGMSRVPRLTQGSAAALAPPPAGGRRAHPPESRRSFTEKINDNERRLATRSALAATAQRELVVGRGHRVGDKVSLPVVVSDLAGVTKTKDALAFLEKLGLGADLERARDGIHVRAGIGKLRGRQYKTPRSLLIVTEDKDAAVDAFGNLPGVDIVAPHELNAEFLAPGGDAGRLVLFTEKALKSVGGEA